MKFNKIIFLVAIAGLIASACSDSDGGVSFDGRVLDRMGIAAVNTVFIPSNEKDAFNQSPPSLDEAVFSEDVETTTQALRDAVGAVAGFPAEDLGLSPADVRGIVIPDVVTLDLSAAEGFPNGRRLSDDVIDTALQVTLNRSVVSDGVGDDSPQITTFPYLGTPN